MQSDFTLKENQKVKESNSKWERQEYSGRNLGDIQGKLISSNDVSYTSLISGFSSLLTYTNYLNNSRAMYNWKMSHSTSNQRN